MKVILISGKAQNGKDTSAAFLKDILTNDGARVCIAHYADLLKHICKAFFGWNGEKDEKGRHILQYVGTDVIRKREPAFWVDFIVKVLELFYDEWDYVIIPDCRFPNEVEKMRDHFDTVHIRVTRPGFVSPLTKEQQKHISETALDNTVPDFTIVNSGTLYDLRDALTDWVLAYTGTHQLTMEEVLCAS